MGTIAVPTTRDTTEATARMETIVIRDAISSFEEWAEPPHLKSQHNYLMKERDQRSEGTQSICS
jgi:hypothetical protein